MSSSHAQHPPRPLIAIVDDDAMVCRALKRIVSSLGIQAETFSGARAFIDALDHGPSFQPACVVLDMHMPDLSGLAIQKHLASSRPAVPVIFLSGCIKMHEREQALAAGALAVFHKPLCDDMQAFITVLTAALKR
ncbi:MAG: response regulator transcription factor [Burkholderiales bacterium]